jgi:mutator protein MutT
MSTIVVAAAVVREADRFLLTKRPDKGHLAGFWEFPGGKVEAGESPEDALVRECMEECGLDVVPLDILDVTFHRYPNKNVLLLFYACGLGERRQVKHIEVADHVWVAASELRRYELPPPDAKLLAKLERGAWVG